MTRLRRQRSLTACLQLNYHLYAPPLPHTSNQHPHQLAINSFFMPPTIRETLQKSMQSSSHPPTAR